MNEIFIGTVGSLLAALLIFVFRNQLNALLGLVFFKVYPKVSGIWKIEAFYEFSSIKKGEIVTEFLKADDDNEVMRAEIKQFGNILRGKIETFEDGKLADVDSLSGKVTPSRIVVLSSESKTEGHHNYGTFLLKISADSKGMDGYHTFLCSGCQDTGDVVVEFTKLEA